MSVTNKEHYFLAGGGEMGELTRSKDWGKTSLGEPDNWPQSLRTTLSIILNSRYPMFLWWGPELICFYNDAYRPSLGKSGKHPTILGQKAEEAWPEIWPIIQPLIKQVLDGKGATWSENQLIPIYRNGKLEDVYWTFSYSPVYDESENIAGVLAICNETTEKVITLKELEESNNRFRNTVKQTPVGITILRGHQYIVELANETYLELVGREEHTFVDRPLFESLPEVREAVGSLLDNVLNTGIPYHGNDVPVPINRHGTEGLFYFDFLYHPLKEEDGKISGIIVTVTEVTDKVESRKKIEQNEERLKIVLEASELGTWELNVKTKVPIYSKRYLEIIGGYKEEVQLTHEQLLSHLHPDDMPVRQKAFADALASGNLYYEARIIWNDQSIHWMEGKGKVFYDENNLPEKMIGTIRDITKEKNYQQELEESEQKFRLLASTMEKQVTDRTRELIMTNESLQKSEERYHLMVEEVQDYAILYLNHLGVVENWNLGAKKIKGYTADEIIGKNFRVFYTTQDQESNLPQKLLNLAKQEGKATQQGWRVRKDGTHFWASVVITAVHNEKKEVIGFSKVTHDLTEKKKADDLLKINALELERKNIDLEKMNKELQSFTYISSHDLQEPLRKIQTFATQIMEREIQNLSEGGKEKFQRMHNAAKRMQALINDLLTYSRTNIQDRIFAKADIAKIVEEVKEDLKEELEQKGAVIETGETCEVRIIPFQVRQWFYNLISNSLKFSKPDKAPRIVIASKIIQGATLNNNQLINDASYCHIVFEDNGIGFEQHYSNKIFEVFQRLHGRSEYTGTGIGLAIVKKIVENHNGIITATGIPDVGAIFNIYIPVIVDFQSN